MKVLMISKALVVGAYHARIREMAKLGVDLTVVVPPSWDSQRLESVKPDGYELLVAETRFGRPALGRHAFHLYYFPNISRIIEREKWDVVHIDEAPFNFCTYHVLRMCRRVGVRAVFSSSENIMKRYPPPFSHFERSVFEGASGAAAISVEARDLLRRRGFSKDIGVLPHGIDPVIFSKHDASPLRNRLGLNGHFVVGYVGRISPEKGLDTLINALALLPPNILLLMVGSGPERPRLEAMMEGLGLSARVKWVPWVASDHVSQYMNVFNVLVLPTRIRSNCTEKFGRVLIEAMACETCVVGSDSGEIPNVIGDAGLTFREGDERELAGCLHQLIGNASLRTSLGQRGRVRTLEHFTHARIARDTVGFYKRVCVSEL